MAPLTKAQRYQIEHDIRLGFNNQMIATGVGCSRRTIERELSRCGGRVPYRAEHAQVHRRRCALNSAANHPTVPAELWPPIEAAILRKLSPEQVVQELKLGVGASTLYRYLRRLNKKPLLKQLRHYSASQRRGGKAGKMAWVGRAKPIRQRPREVLTRDTTGHLECDSIVGQRNESHKIVVLRDRAPCASYAWAGCPTAPQPRWHAS